MLARVRRWFVPRKPFSQRVAFGVLEWRTKAAVPLFRKDLVFKEKKCQLVSVSEPSFSPQNEVQHVGMIGFKTYY